MHHSGIKCLVTEVINGLGPWLEHLVLFFAKAVEICCLLIVVSEEFP